MPDGDETKGEAKNEAKHPGWWTRANDLSWAKVKTRIMDEWHRIQQEASKLDKKLDQKLNRSAEEHAVAFGHGARSAYERFTAWTTEFEKKLEEDWKAMGAAQRWEKVRDAIKHGWEQSRK
jgi:argininosuccinate lyase